MKLAVPCGGGRWWCFMQVLLSPLTTQRVNSFNCLAFSTVAWCRLCWIPHLSCWINNLHPTVPSGFDFLVSVAFWFLCFKSWLHLALLTFVFPGEVPGEVMAFSSNQDCSSFMELEVRFISLIRIVRIQLWNESSSLFTDRFPQRVWVGYVAKGECWATELGWTSLL